VAASAAAERAASSCASSSLRFCCTLRSRSSASAVLSARKRLPVSLQISCTPCQRLKATYCQQATPAPLGARAASSGHGGASNLHRPCCPKAEQPARRRCHRAMKTCPPQASPCPRRMRCCPCPPMSAGTGSSACGGAVGSPPGPSLHSAAAVPGRLFRLWAARAVQVRTLRHGRCGPRGPWAAQVPPAGAWRTVPRALTYELCESKSA